MFMRTFSSLKPISFSQQRYELYEEAHHVRRSREGKVPTAAKLTQEESLDTPQVFSLFPQFTDHAPPDTLLSLCTFQTADPLHCWAQPGPTPAGR